jgi:uncharacterized membrane protein
MQETTTVNLTVEEVAFARSAIRVLRILTAIGVAIAIPVLLVLALPVLSYALLAAVLVSPVVIGVVLFRSARQDVPQAS